MGCCGQNRRSVAYQKAPKIVPGPARIASRGRDSSRSSNPPKRTSEVGSKCRYCGSVITEKIKKTIRGWVRIGWCSKCRLEV